MGIDRICHGDHVVGLPRHWTTDKTCRTSWASAFSSFGKFGMISLGLFWVASAFVYWIANSSQLCLAADGVHHRSLPWGNLQRHNWSTVSDIAVDCRNRRRGQDLHYTLTFTDGTKLDIADAMPSWKESYEFRSRLAGVPFQFTGDVHSSCPDWYSDWVGQRP